MDEIKQETTDSGKVFQARSNVRLSLEATVDWRTAAREDYRFVQGKQWTDTDKKALDKQGRPAITINRCRPMINQVSGYFGQNMPEANFLPRTDGDEEICNIAKGITKYVYDKCMYQRQKKKVARDRLICGVGYYWVFYDFDYDKMDGTIKIERRSPFEVFVDPESVREDLSDAEFCGVYSWEDPNELQLLYPEAKDQIATLEHQYDAEERAVDMVANEPMWYSKQLKKLRVVQYWYKERAYRNVYQTSSGVEEETDELKSMASLGVPGVTKQRIPTTNIRFMVFVDDVLLEEGDSPYKHKRFPLVQEFAYYTGEKDENDASIEPAGIIRDLKDVQREINKHRSRRMHLTNTQANGLWLIYGQSTPEFDAQLKTHGTTPGAVLHAPPSVTKVDRLVPDGVSLSDVEIEKTSGEDFYTISGINPETMSNGNVPSYMSGVAIDRRQQAAFTQVSDLAEEGNYSERLVLDLLWGEVGRPGLIVQYFTDAKVMRIMFDNGEYGFVNLQPGMGEAKQMQTAIDPTTGQPQVDEKGQLVQRVLYDLSKFDFDIVVVPSQSTPTLMAANLQQLIEAQKVGIQVPPEMLLEFLPVNNKAQLRKMLQAAASAPKTEPKVSLTAAFKDLPIEAKVAALAELGINVSPESLLQQKMIEKVNPRPQGGGTVAS